MFLHTLTYRSTGYTLALFVSVRLFSLSLCLTVNLSSRKIPGLNVYAQMQNEKEQEMMSPANPTEATPSSQRDLVHSLEILDTEFNSRPIGKYPLWFDFCLCVAIHLFFRPLLAIIHSIVIMCLLCHEAHPVLFVVCFSEVKGSGQGVNENDKAKWVWWTVSGTINQLWSAVAF